MDAQQITELDDEGYHQIVSSNAFAPTRDPEVWAVLTDPANITRTRATLTDVVQRVTNTLRKRKEEREAFQQACHDKGPAGKAEWFAGKREYDEWRHRAVNFLRTHQTCLAEVAKLQKDINRASNHHLAVDHREALRKLAVAVQRHQAAHARAGGIADQADYELWQLLDRVTVPVGADREETSLRTMLDIYWTDVQPVDVAGEVTAGMERTMRAAPAGQASRFSGVPKARHVDNGKHLA